MRTPATDADMLAAVLLQVGRTGAEVRALTGGSVNRVFRVSSPGRPDVVVRFPVDRRRADESPVEMWASRAAPTVGIPVARALAAGRAIDVPYLVSEYVPPATLGPERPWTRLGGYARRVGVIDPTGAPESLFSRFGTDLAVAWRSHLEYNLAALDEEDPLLRDGAYPAGDAPRLQRIVQGLGTVPFAFGPAHGDLAPRNLISRGPDLAPVLIDWGGATTGPTPWTDAQRVFRWAHCEQAITTADLDEFLAAAGIGTDADRHVLAALSALHLVDVTRWSRERRPDLYGEYLRACRAGLQSLHALLPR